MHHSSFVAAYRTNKEIYKRDYECLGQCQKDLLQSVMQGTVRKLDAKEFTWENHPNEEFIAFETTWRRQLFHVLNNKYASVIDASRKYHTQMQRSFYKSCSQVLKTTGGHSSFLGYQIY